MSSWSGPSTYAHEVQGLVVHWQLGKGRHTEDAEQDEPCGRDEDHTLLSARGTLSRVVELTGRMSNGRSLIGCGRRIHSVARSYRCCTTRVGWG